MTTPILNFNKNKYKAEIYKQMALMTGICFLSAFLLSKAKIGFIHNYKEDYIVATILLMILMVGIMIAISNQCKKSCEQNESKLKQYGFAYAFVFLASLSVSGALIIYDAQSVVYSFATACLVFLSSAIYAHNSKNPNLEKNLLHHGAKLSLGAIALCLFNLSIGSSAAHTAISIMCFALIIIIEILNSIAIDKKLNLIEKTRDIIIKKENNSGYKQEIFNLYDNSEQIFFFNNKNKQITENEFVAQSAIYLASKTTIIDTKKITCDDQNQKEKVAENLVPYAALCLFSQIISYFLMIIEALGKKQSNQKSSSIIDFIPNLSVDDFNLAEPFEKLESTITI